MSESQQMINNCEVDNRIRQAKSGFKEM